MLKNRFTIVLLLSLCLIGIVYADVTTIEDNDGNGNAYSTTIAYTADGGLVISGVLVTGAETASVSSDGENTDLLTSAENAAEVTGADTFVAGSTSIGVEGSSASASVIASGNDNIAVSEEQSATISPITDGSVASQTAEVSGDEAVASTVAVSDEGTATATTVVTDGTITTDQSASTTGVVGALGAEQDSTVEGAQGLATVTATDDVGATAESSAIVVDGTIDASQNAVVWSTIGVDVNQQTTAEGEEAAVTSTSTATNGDTAAASAEVTNGEISVNNQYAGNWGDDRAFTGNIDAVVTGDNGSASVTAAAADGATASAIASMENGEVNVDQSAYAVGGAGVSQDGLVTGTNVAASATADDGQGNSVNVDASATGDGIFGTTGTIETEQSAEADPTSDTKGSQHTIINALRGSATTEVSGGEATAGASAESSFGGLDTDQSASITGGVVCAEQETKASGLMARADTYASGPEGTAETSVYALYGDINADQNAGITGGVVYADQVSEAGGYMASAETSTSSSEGSASASAEVLLGDITVDQTASTAAGSRAPGAFQHTTVDGRQGSATVTATDETGATAEASATIVGGTLTTGQDAIVWSNVGVDVTQQTTASGSEASVISTSTATNGDTATTSAEVINGEIIAYNQYAGNFGAEGSFAGSYNTVVTGDSGSVSVSAAAVDGATASATSSMENGEIDVASQRANAYGAADARQTVDLNGNNLTASTAADDGRGNLINVNAVASSGEINAQQNATADPGSGADGAQNTVINAESGSASVTANAADGATASTTSSMTGGDLNVDQYGEASGSASAGQTASVTGITANSYSVTNNGLGDSAFVVATVFGGVLNTDQGVTADPATGVTGSQETYVIAPDNIGIIAAQAGSSLSSNVANVQATVAIGSISAAQNVATDVNEANDAYAEQTVRAVTDGLGATTTSAESNERGVNIETVVSNSNMYSQSHAYAGNEMNTAVEEESNDHTTSGGTSLSQSTAWNSNSVKIVALTGADDTYAYALATDTTTEAEVLW